MTSDRFKQVERLFQEARRLDPDARGAFLAKAGGSDASLREEVEALLREHDHPTGAPLGEPALGSGFRINEPEAITGAAVPKRVGRYDIRRVLGEGGMGVVYLAEQESTGRPVALKVIKPGFGAPSLLRRFEHEAQALGRLRHPGIAQVYEAGIHQDASGRFPFIAMEYVEGPCITDYARRENLPARRRLELVVKICDAVQHAHQKGVIHRDLKPGNILVDEGTKGEGGQPKILDFGVARLTDADIRTTTLRTDVGQLLGTIQYMSPEQAVGDPDELDTRSDVYSLGVICYELLGGRLPYDLDRKMIHEAVRVIREVDPAPLSTVDRVFRGDLNTILAKCLEKDKTRRYPSAAALAEDLRRYLSDEPITAHPPSAMYQLRKFARRNRRLVASVALFVMILVAGIVTTSWLAIDANRARAAEALQKDRAQRRFDEVRALANIFLYEFDEQIEHLAGALPARRLIVETGLEYLDRLASETEGDPELRVDVAVGYARLGDIQGGQMRSNLGDTAGARESYAKAVELLEGDPPLSRRGQIQLLSAYDMLAGIEHELNNVDQQMTYLGKAQRVGNDLVASDPDDSESKGLLAKVLEHMATALRDQGRLEEGLAILRRAHAMWVQLRDENPEDPDLQRAFAVVQFQMGMFQLAAKEHAEALENFRGFVSAIEHLVEADPGHERYQRDLRVSIDRIGDCLKALGRHEEALESYEKALALSEADLARSPRNADGLRGVAIEACHVGEMQLVLGRLDAALVAFDRQLEAARALVTVQPASSYVQRDLGVALYKMGEFHAAAAGIEVDDAARSARWHRAREWFERCHDKFVQMRDEELLWASDTGVFDDITAEIRKCDEAITALERPADTAASGAGEREGG